ncbi:hypothetical protein BP5796_11944 [Coleophoma crateriformis]|uniref:Uncharacterized protein n=1 Tax=Coleophoma crateriformis TaxID=565419 RepID=A0A3D8QBJ3_9HELO|nr:hypothetical protein BP5796_11944 [Coleophoma crateriformis]
MYRRALGWYCAPDTRAGNLNVRIGRFRSSGAGRAVTTMDGAGPWTGRANHRRQSRRPGATTVRTGVLDPEQHVRRAGYGAGDGERWRWRLEEGDG